MTNASAPRIRLRARPGATPDSARLIGDLQTEPAKKRKPNKGSWAKGFCPNPKGRPKGAKGIKTIARQILSEKVNVRTAKGAKKVALLEALLRKEAELAANGDWRARKTIIDLCRWSMTEPTEGPGAARSVEPEPDHMAETTQAILDLYAEEIRAQTLADLETRKEVAR